MNADFQAAHLGSDKTLWARLRALEDSDVMVGCQMKHFLGKFAAELAYTWKKDAAAEGNPAVHGLFGVPLHLRMAHNWKMAPGVTFDSVQSLGKEFKTRDRVDF